MLSISFYNRVDLSRSKFISQSETVDVIENFAYHIIILDHMTGHKIRILESSGPNDAINFSRLI